MVMRSVLLLSLFLFISELRCATAQSPVGSPAVEVDVTPVSGTRDETFRLTISVSSSDGREPVLESSPDFEIASIGTSSQIQIVNGQTTAENYFLYELTPRTTGTLLSPSGTVTVSGKTISLPQKEIRVSRGAPSSSPRTPPAIKGTSLTRTLSAEEVFEGEQVITTLRLLSQERIEKGSFDSLVYNGFWKENLGEPTVRSVRRGQETFRLHEVRHALFPLSPGEHSLPPARLQLLIRERLSRSSPFPRFRLFDPDFFGSGSLKKVSVFSNASSLQVRPLPPVPDEYRGQSAHSHIPVGEVTLSLGVGTDPVQAGAGKTVVVTVESDGNIRPIDTLSVQLPPFLKRYDDATEEVLSSRGGRFALKKRFRFSLVPERSGSYEIEPISLLTFDPKKERYTVVSTRPIRFTAESSGHQEGNTASPSPTEAPLTEASPAPEGRELFRYREETLLEYLTRTVSTSLLLFLTACLLAFCAFCWILFWMIKKATLRRTVLRSKRRHLRSRLSGGEDYRGLRERFIEGLSFLLGADEGESFRGPLLEQKLQESGGPEKLREEILLHLDSLDALAFGKVEESSRLQEAKARSLSLLEEFLSSTEINL